MGTNVCNIWRFRFIIYIRRPLLMGERVRELCGIRLWNAVAREITGSRCLPARRPVGGVRTASGNVWHRESASEDEIEKICTAVRKRRLAPREQRSKDEKHGHGV